MADVSLTSGMRANLLQLQMTERLMDRTQGRIATGKKVNSALDGPAAYFAAKALTDRAGDLASLKDSMGQGISTIKAADAGLSQITSLVEQAKAIANTANQNLGTDDASVASRAASAAQYDALLTQIDSMVADSSYAGKNLLLGNGSTLAATTATAAALDAATTGVSGSTVINATTADSYLVDVTVAQYGRIDTAGTNYVADVAAGVASMNTAATALTTTNLTVSGVADAEVANKVNLMVNTTTSTSTNNLNVTLTYGNYSWTSADIPDAADSGTITATLGGISISFDYVRTAGDAVTNQAAVVIFNGAGNGHATDQRITIDSTTDSNTGTAGTVTLSSFANDASRTAGSQLLAAGTISQTFETGTVRFALSDPTVLVDGEGAVSLVTEGTAGGTANDLSILFNSKATSSVSIASIATDFASLGVSTSISSWAAGTDITSAITQLDAALATLRDTGQSLATNLSVVQTREDFTSEFINTLEEGADKWTLADSNLEGANMLMLQTRQQLGTVSLSIASQAAQSILRLFG